MEQIRPHRHLPAELAACLRDARHARGWSLRDATRATGVSLSMLSRLEQCVRVLTTTEIELVPKLALLFGDPMTANVAGKVFTCQEADVIVEILVEVAGNPDAARWLVGHAPVDENPDEVDTTDRHHGMDEEAAKAWALSR